MVTTTRFSGRKSGAVRAALLSDRLQQTRTHANRAQRRHGQRKGRLPERMRKDETCWIWSEQGCFAGASENKRGVTGLGLLPVSKAKAFVRSSSASRGWYPHSKSVRERPLNFRTFCRTPQGE